MFPGTLRRLAAHLPLLPAVLLLAPLLLSATPVWAQDVSTQPPKIYERHLKPLLLDGSQAVETARSVSDRVADGEGGSVLLSESLTRVEEDGGLIRVQHEIYRANTDDMVESVARVEVPYRRGEQTIHVALARTLLSDGTPVPVRAQAMFVQTPQDRADESLYTDQAELVILFPRVTAGASVEYVVVIEEDEFRIPGEFTDLHVFQYFWPVDVMRRVLELPAGLASRLRVTEVGDGVPATRREATKSGGSRFTWEARDLPSYQPTTWSQPLSETGPAVWLSTLDSWEVLADWYRGLLVGRTELPDELKIQVDEWTEGLEDREDVVRTLHQKVADDIRYTGLEFGIAGFQPKPPLEVWHDRFGDCKDKANLLRALLAHEGIRSHLVLIDTEHAGLVETRSPDFRHFNHAILGIEMQPGSRRLLFADPTIPYLPPGVLGGADADRPVLVVRDEGYQFTRTPKQSAGELDALFDLDVDSEGLAGWVRVHVTGARSSGYRSFLQSEELWQKRENVQLYLSGWFPDAEVVDVELIPDDGGDDQATYVMRAYFLHRGEAFAATRDGEALPLALPDPFRRPSAESLEQGGRGRAFLRPETSQVQVRYRMPEGWTATSVPDPFRSDLPTTEMAASWSCEPGACTAEIRMEQVRNLLDAGARRALGTEIARFEDWLAKPVKVVPSQGGAPQTNLAQSADPSPNVDLEEFPRLTSAAGQLLLVERKYPAATHAEQRRAALSRVVEWFPGESDADAVFEAKMRQADLDCAAEDPAGEASMKEILQAPSPEVSAETRAWGSFVLSRCSTVEQDEKETILRRLAQDESLSDFRRFWSAYTLADDLDEAGRPESEALAALALAPDGLAPELMAEQAVLEAWLRARDPELDASLAAYLEGEQAALVVQRLSESLQRWESMGAQQEVEAIYAALEPLLDNREDLAEAASTLRGLGLSAADSEMRAAAAARVAEILASDLAPEWWQRITVAEADDEAALVAKTEKLGNTELAAEYLRHLGELVARYPGRADFSDRLRQFVATFDYFFPQEKASGPLVDTLELLPSSDTNYFEAVFLKARRAERDDGGEAALRLMDEALADASMNDQIRTSLIYEQGRVLERLGRPDDALETYSLLVPYRGLWLRAHDADLRRALLHLEAGRYEAALAVATQLAELLEDDIAGADSPDQMRNLAKMSKTPEAALDYWARHDDWFATWRALAADLGWTPPESPEAAELGDQTAFGTDVGGTLEASDLQGYLGLTDTLLRAARTDPALLPDAGVILARGGQVAPERSGDLRDLAIDLLAAAPDVASPLGGEDLAGRSSLLRFSFLVDSERYDEADEEKESYLTWARPEGDVYRRMHLISAMQAEITGEGIEEAAEGLRSTLTPEWSDPSRGMAVNQLADLYHALGRTQAELALLTAEAELANRREAPYAAGLTERLESLRSMTEGMGDFEEALRAWRSNQAPSWIEFAKPHDLSEEPWASKSPSEWLEDEDLTQAEKVKVALLAGLDESLPPTARTEAVESLPLALSNTADWHRVRVFGALEPFLDPERWDDEVRKEAATWMAFDAHTAELRERVASDPAYQLIDEGSRTRLEDRWKYQNIQDGPLPELKAAIEELLAEAVLDELEVERLNIYLGSLGYRFGRQQVEPYLASLPDLRLAGEDHGGARLHLEHSRIVRRMKEDQPLDAALRQLALRWSGGEPPEPSDWYDLAGFRVTAALLPADEAEAHFMYELAAQYGGRLSAQEVMQVYVFLDDGSDVWLGRFEELVTTVAEHAADDKVRAELLEQAAFRTRDDPRLLAVLESVLAPWRRDVDAADTRALLRRVELHRAVLAGESIDWKAELDADSAKAYRGAIQSLQIRDLVSRDRKEELAALLQERSFDELLDPARVDDHLVAARAANDQDVEALLVKVARDELDRAVLSSWVRPDGDRIRWALRLDGVLGEPDRIPDEWFAHQKAMLKNENLLRDLAEHHAENRRPAGP